VWIFDLTFSVWIRNQFVGDKEEKGGFPQGSSASSVRTLLVVRTMESCPGLAWAARWATTIPMQGVGGVGQARPAVGFRPTAK
jgi:hypothetical protein